MIEGPSPTDEPLLLLGEVHTGLLQHSTALPPAGCRRLLDALHSDRVRAFERPIAHAVSPEKLTGVDCRMATPTGAGPRGIGSITTRAMVTGGHVIQASAVARVARSPASHRLPWSHYLARPGRVEVVGAADADALATGFLSETRPPATLDPGGPAARTMDALQRDDALDRRPPFRAGRTMLRWAALIGPPEADGSVRFTVQRRLRRTLLLACSTPQVPAVAEFCADLALHDWLLTTLLNLVHRSGIGAAARTEVVQRLGPAVDHLLPLWMPAARSDDSVIGFWESLDRRPGLSRQWQGTVDRIRDQLAPHDRPHDCRT